MTNLPDPRPLSCYRPTTNNAQMLRLAAISAARTLDAEVFAAIKQAEPCVFVYRGGMDSPHKYVVREYPALGRLPGGSRTLARFLPEQWSDHLPLYLVFEERSANETLLLRRNNGNRRWLTKERPDLSENLIRGVGLNAAHADYLARTLAARRMHEIAKERQLPYLDALVSNI